jgi:hypothetical protein
MNRLLPLPVLLVLGLPFCSPPDLGTTAAVAACTTYAAAYCTHEQMCALGFFVVRWPDLATCKLYTTNDCINNAIAPQSAYTPATAQACAMQVPSWNCNDALDYVNPPSACTPPSGPRPNGTGCALGTQCQSGFCNIASGRVCGACDVAPQPGAPCGYANNRPTFCGRGNYCNDQNVCTPISTVGGTCGAHQLCELGFPCAAGVCIVGNTHVGDRCGGMSNQGCDLTQDLDCNGQTLSCQPIEIVGPGQPCGYLFNQFIHCGGGSVCENGTCVASSMLGQACDLAAGPSCLPPLRCVTAQDGGTSGTCIVADATQCP